MTLRVLGRPAFATRYWNPYPWLLCTHLREIGVQVDESTRRRVVAADHDVLHIHWPEQHLNHRNRSYAYARTLSLLAQLDYLRLRGTRIVWTVHNLAAHERRYPRFERWFWRQFVRRLDGYICLTEASRELAVERFPGLGRLPGVVIPHGHYRDAYPNTVSRCEARERLNVPPGSTLMLFLGAIREYKNVPLLIDAFRGLEDPDVLLVVAGKPSDSTIAHEVHEHAAGDLRIRTVLAHVPDSDLQVYFGAADIVVLPYREILNSGSAILSLSFNRPVLLPSSACGAELQGLVGRDWVRIYEGSLETRHLREAVDWAVHSSRPETADLAALSWDRIARSTAEFFERVVGGRDDAPVSGEAPVYQARG